MYKNTSLRRLFTAYKYYYEASRGKNTYDSSELAKQGVNGYLEYLDSMVKIYPDWLDDIDTVIENQVRILSGMSECYDRPVNRDKKTLVTRWSL